MSNRRHAISKRPASSEEVEYWSHAAASLAALSHFYAEANTTDVVGKVNRLISQWPMDAVESDDLPASDGFETVKSMYKKLNAGLVEIKQGADVELKAIDAALEGVSVLIGLRRASEAIVQEKRKRPRIGSPASGAATPVAGVPAAKNGSISITVPARSSAAPSGPGPIPFSRNPKDRREALARQLPLANGRRVAFHAPTKEDPNTWILAIIIECLQGDKNRYCVQDAEPLENGDPGRQYNATLRSIIPLSDPEAPADSPIHPSSVYQFSAGETVMALYPDTSCFYRAEVINRVAGADVPLYTLKFEDDDDLEHKVPAHYVVEWPDPVGHAGKK